VALIVGTALNLINQWDAVTSNQVINYRKAILTYCVPYLVSSFSAWSTRPTKNVAIE
jgi:hypothetical protein